MLDHTSKHLKVCQKYSAACHISTLLSVFGIAVKHGLVFDILIETFIVNHFRSSLSLLSYWSAVYLFVLFHSDGLLETVLNISRHKVLQRRYALQYLMEKHNPREWGEVSFTVSGGGGKTCLN